MSDKNKIKLLLSAALSVVLSACNSDVTTATSDSCLIGPQERIFNSPGLENSPTITPQGGLQVTVERDIIYGQGLTHKVWAGEESEPMDLLMDVYSPEETTGKRPAVLIVHGGGFFTGSKDGEERMARYFAQRGFVAYVINYRLMRHRGSIPKNWYSVSRLLFFIPPLRDLFRTGYTGTRDAKAALRWIHTHHQNYNIDTNYISTIGVSAGAQIAIALGVSKDQDYLEEISLSEDPTLASTNLGASTKVASVVSFWGSGFIVDGLGILNGKKRWQTNETPTLMIHGTLDYIVPFFEAVRAGFNLCRGAGGLTFHTLHNAVHDPWHRLIYGKTMYEEALDFITTTQNLGE